MSYQQPADLLCQLLAYSSLPSLYVAHATAGYLVSVDAYMNLQLASTEEYIDGQFTGNLGEVLIRSTPVRTPEASTAKA